MSELQRPRILDLPERVAALPGPDRARVERLFEVSRRRSRLTVPAALRASILAWHGKDGIERVSEQTVVRVACRATGEETLFNPLREAARPPAASSREIEQLIERTRHACDFCQPQERTTCEPWGRIHGAHAVSAANAARYDACHGLVIFREHDPWQFDGERVRDYLSVADRWIERMRHDDRSLRFPCLLWNCLAAAGASQVHGHLHVLLSNQGPYGRQARMERARVEHRRGGGQSLWGEWLAAHGALGLAGGDLEVMWAASLTPIRDREVVLVARAMGDRLADAIATVLGTLRDRFGTQSFNCAIELPPVGEAGRVIARCVDRGNPLRAGGGVGASELYGAPVVAADPFDVADALRAAMVGG